jgi:hypothetical protein
MVVRKPLKEFKVTHSAWVSFCPVWLNNIESDAPDVLARYHLDWVFDAAVWYQGMRDSIIQLCVPDYPIGFWFSHVYELSPPITVKRRWKGEDKPTTEDESSH